MQREEGEEKDKKESEENGGTNSARHGLAFAEARNVASDRKRSQKNRNRN